VSGTRPEEAAAGDRPPPGEPADGLQLLCAVAVNAAAGTLFAWSVLLPALGQDLGRSADELGTVFSSALLVFALAVLFGGGAVDRHGPRSTAAVAGLLSGGGLALAAVAGDLLTLHVGIGVLFGFGSGLAYLSAVTWAGTRDRSRRARAIGVVVAAYALGPVAAAPLGSLGVDLLGRRPTLVVAAAVVAAVTLAASRGLPGPTGAARTQRLPEGLPPVGDPLALAALWLLFLAAVAPGLLAFAYAAQIATERGVAPGTAGVVVALMAVGNVAGRLLSAPLTVRVGLRASLWGSLAALVAALAMLAWSSAAPVAVVGLVLLALQYGLVSALLPAATRRVSGAARFGTAYGRVFSSFGPAAVAGPALGAVLHDSADGYARGFQASLVGVVVAMSALATYQHRLGLVASSDVKRWGQSHH
jgi:MFS transporter, OFA family, oxalate/formate antiporter